MNSLKCRFCKTDLKHTFFDLGMMPNANSYLRQEELQKRELFFPLKAYICDKCLLVQLQEFQSPRELFSNYSYFSSYSDSWLKHAKKYTDKIVKRFGFNSSSRVIEIASNDGYLLRYFKDRGIPVLGIEPAENVAAVAESAGIPTITEFFSTEIARQLADSGQKADLVVGNNVLAHVPDLNDFVNGMKQLLKPQGIITMEFPHLMRLINGNQFDTIYHEHFSYFSFLTVQKVFVKHGLLIFDVEELSTHGGSLRIYARHKEDGSKPILEPVDVLLNSEKKAGLNALDTYFIFGERVRRTKRKLLSFLIQAKEEGKSIAAYGAPAKGNILLNYCGIGTDFIDYTVDRSPHKQGCFLPGTHIPVYHPDKIKDTRPDYLLILPWNIKQEIMEHTAYVREWGCKFVVPIPDIKVL